MKFKTRSGPPKPQQNFKIEGNLIVVKNGGILPPRCVKCNKACKIRIRQKLQWMPAWVRIFSVIVRKTVGKETYVTIGLCQRHLKKNRFIEKIGRIFLLLGIGIFISAFFTTHFFPLISAGVLFFILGLGIGSAGAPIKAVYMDNYMVKIKGCSKEFLNSVAIKNTEQD